MNDNVEFNNELNDLTGKWVPLEGKLYLYDGASDDERIVDVINAEKAEEVYWTFVYQFEQGLHGH